MTTETITKPLTEQTPVEIDTQLAALYYEEQAIQGKLAFAQQRVRDAAGDKLSGNSWTPARQRKWGMTWKEAQAKAREIAATESDGAYTYSKAGAAQAALKNFDGLVAKLLANDEAQCLLLAEFSRRGGWTQAFLVTNNGGHVHKSRECSTCYPARFDPESGEWKAGTQFFWVTDYSGHDEAEIVADAGERACTICYPSAPVGTLDRPTKIFSDDERDAQQRKADREAKKEAAKEKLIFAPDGSVIRGDYGDIKTKIAARNELSKIVKDEVFYPDSSRRDGQDALKAVLIEALTAAGFDTDDIIAKATKRAHKERKDGEKHAREMGWIQ